MTPVGTAIPAVAEWPALRIAWRRGTIERRDLDEMTQANAAMLLSRMERRGLLRRIAHGHYAPTHTRQTMIDMLMGDE